MLVVYVILSFVVIFTSGMHYALWDNGLSKNSIYFSIGLGIVGLYNIISMIGYLSKFGAH